MMSVDGGKAELMLGCVPVWFCRKAEVVADMPALSFNERSLYFIIFIIFGYPRSKDVPFDYQFFPSNFGRFIGGLSRKLFAG